MADSRDTPPTGSGEHGSEEHAVEGGPDASVTVASDAVASDTVSSDTVLPGTDSSADDPAPSASTGSHRAVAGGTTSAAGDSSVSGADGEPLPDAKPVDDIAPIGDGRETLRATSDPSVDAPTVGGPEDAETTAGTQDTSDSHAAASATTAAPATSVPAAATVPATTAAAAVAPATTGTGAPGAAPAPTPTATRDPHPHTAENPALDRDAARRAAVRDGVINARPPFARFLQVVVAVFFPIIVLAGAVRAVATSTFLWIEYNRPGFPADQFGFSLEDRMTYGSYALDYVLNFAPPRYLGELTTPGGTPLFLDSEVGHMADVKGVLGVAFAVALLMFVLTVLACIYLSRRYRGGIRRGLFAGAVLTLLGIVALAVLAITAWEAFFTQVHALFFSEGTWTFRVDDTLIRLFPEQFWTDSAVVVGILVLLATLLTLVLTWPTKARRERSKRAQEAQQLKYLESLRTS